MEIVVLKFGGSSLADKERIFCAANRIAENCKDGRGVVVVLSAQGDTTDDLIEKAREINERPSKREMDALLACGEQISAALMAIALESLGFPVVSLTGWQAGVRTDSNHGAARVKSINSERILKELDDRKIVIITGFQGIDKYDDITTLGRGGSDTSAAAIAAALHASVCRIYTDVDGVYTADPRIVSDAKKLDEISYDEMLELASLGANVLHNRSVEMAKKFNIVLEVLSSKTGEPGTIVREVRKMERMLVRGVTRDNNVARISLINVEDKPGKAFQVFSVLAKEKINVDVILQSIGRGNKKDISFTVSRDSLEPAIKAIRENSAVIGAEDIAFATEVSKVSIVGAGMTSNPGIASKMFEALFDANINIHMISTSEIKISVLVDEKDAEAAVRAIHYKFNV